MTFRLRSRGGGGSTPSAPVNTVLPAITGSPTVDSTLTASTGTWTGSPTSFAYQWKADGANVGTNANTYVPVTGDVGKNITCTVAATNAGGSTAATSSAVGPVVEAGGLITNASELQAALTLNASAGGVTLDVSPLATDLDGFTFTNINPAAPIVLRSANTSLVSMASVRFANSTNIHFEYFDFGDNITTGFCVDTSPSGLVLTDIRFWRCSAYGATYDVNGDYSVGAAPTARSGFGCVFRRIWVMECSFQYLNNAVKPNSMRGRCRVDKNKFDAIYDDNAACYWDPLNDPPHYSTFNWNEITRPTGLETDNGGGGPHSDGIQFARIVSAGGPLIGVECIGNEVFDGNSRGSLQMNIVRATTASYLHMKCAHNRHYVNSDSTLPGDGKAPALDDQSEAWCFNNAGFHTKPDFAGNVGTDAFVTNKTGNYSLMRNNVGTHVDTTGNVRKENNVVLAKSSAAYLALVDGPAFSPTTLEQCRTMYKYKAGGVLAHLRDTVDYVAKTVVLADEPGWIAVESLTGQAAATAIESPWLKLMGGPAGRPLSVTNCQYQIADDASGTNATTYTSASGTMDAGKFIRTKAMTGASGSSVTPTITIDGYVNSYTLTAA